MSGVSPVETKSQKTRRRIVGHATELVHRQGLKNTTIDDVVRAADVTKGSFYFHFASKEELGYAVIDNASAYFLNGLERIGRAPTLSGKERLEGMLALIRSAVEEHDCAKGCILGNLALEMSDLHDGYRAKLAEVFEGWAELFREVLEQMLREGHLSREMNAADFALHTVAVLEGGIMLSKVMRDPAPLRSETDRLLRELADYRKKEGRVV